MQSRNFCQKTPSHMPLRDDSTTLREAVQLLKRSSVQVAKNIVLAGVGSLHLLDETPSTSGSGTNFLNQSEDPGTRCSLKQSTMSKNTAVMLRSHKAAMIVRRTHFYVMSHRPALLLLPIPAGITRRRRHKLCHMLCSLIRSVREATVLRPFQHPVQHDQ